ncbi:hypothetical protein [Planobispora longispora]|uniref:Uncharacterized protein n=1 Tax=Planobispora longispora TaxID=28887 RepID=A0A8J3RJS7_9ACTN|nr:hypothetical protein [Planobispora longispora]BFE85657.1 hypothetical protein GCM10020093_082580 [Planobispora longispora]GIH76268.1 hypothetical protein Plo01_26970 [Planobispora longispora]
MNKAVFDEVSVLWAEHMGLTFPDGLRGVEIHGEPVAYLDFCMAGPLTSYVGSRRGVLDPDQLQTVRECARDLRALLPRVHRRENRAYVARLLRIADLIIGDATDQESSL